ncbi:MAG: glycosyltransferase family 2 protein [candidate division WOR-3 bacterium]
MDKLLSIVIPTFNRKTLTDRAVESVRSEFPELVEIIVVDDCSDIPYSFSSHNSSKIEVKVFRLEKNVGPGMARQAGVKSANGKFIAFLDSDDFYDKGWVDWIIKKIRELNGRDSLLIISGITKGERKVGALVRKMLSTMPQPLLLFAARVVAIMFNPFYTPSLVMDRELCFFKEGLRYCEDYYLTVYALFHARQLILPNVTAVYLGREPNTWGGETSQRSKMFWGEMQVRMSMWTELQLPLAYKLLIPFGIIYQWLRVGLKLLNSVVSGKWLK